MGCEECDRGDGDRELRDGGLGDVPLQLSLYQSRLICRAALESLRRGGSEWCGVRRWCTGERQGLGHLGSLHPV